MDGESEIAGVAEFDVFLASPMTVSHLGSSVRAQIDRVRDALVRYGRFTVFCAVTYKESRGDGPGVSFQKNLDAIGVSRCLLLVVPSDEIDRSSVWIELGMAMALRLPVIIAAPDETHIPFLARRALDGAVDGGSTRVRSFWHHGRLDEVTDLVVTRGPQLFDSFFD